MQNLQCFHFITFVHHHICRRRWGFAKLQHLKTARPARSHGSAEELETTTQVTLHAEKLPRPGHAKCQTCRTAHSGLRAFGTILAGATRQGYLRKSACVHNPAGRSRCGQCHLELDCSKQNSSALYGRRATGSLLCSASVLAGTSSVDSLRPNTHREK